MGTRYLKYPEIDKRKWDDCIDRSLNSLIYAKSFYLDAMAENWDGIVLDDYEAVMPLTWKRKWTIRYLYQPAFFQQGGIFSLRSIDQALVQECLLLAFSHFKFAEITLNFSNDPGVVEQGSVSMRNNFVLALSRSYEEIRSGYDSIAIKNLKRANNAGLEFSASSNYLPALEMYEELYSPRLPYFYSNDFINFKSVCEKLSAENKLLARNVTGRDNELLAAAVLLIDGNRLYNVISCISPAGKLAQANYFLYDQLIKEFSNSAYLLDFEGSDVKGIAAFYNRFSPQNQPYPFIKMNRLPAAVKLIKK
jgi:hypothetical protein